MKVKILKTDERLGISEGEIYAARRYRHDPQEKVELLSREPDGYDPMCNQYIDSVAHLINGQWMVVEDGKYVPAKA